MFPGAERPHLFIQPSADGHVSCFHLWAGTTVAAPNAGVHGSVGVPVSNALGQIPRG